MLGKKLLMTAALAAGVMLLGGCGMFGQSKWTPQGSSAIEINKDGKITELISEKLDQAYYDAAELQNMIQSEVADYTAKHGADSVSVKSFEEAEGKVNLEIEYASAQDYAGFNNTEFYYGSVISAQLDGYLFDASYKGVKDGVVQGQPVSGDDVIRRMDGEVLILRAPMEVHLPGNVLFTSTNADVLSADTVNATGESKEEDREELVLPSNEVYTPKEASFEEQKEANRVYIIFEID